MVGVQGQNALAAIGVSKTTVDQSEFEAIDVSFLELLPRARASSSSFPGLFLPAPGSQWQSAGVCLVNSRRKISYKFFQYTGKTTNTEPKTREPD